MADWYICYDNHKQDASLAGNGARMPNELQTMVAPCSHIRALFWSVLYLFNKATHSHHTTQGDSYINYRANIQNDGRNIWANDNKAPFMVSSTRNMTEYTFFTAPVSEQNTQ